jgi:hypothetical protein
MAKRKSKAATPVKTCAGRDFSALQYEMLDWLNALTCAVHSLGGCSELDGSELGSQARSVARLCNRNLHRLMDELERWEMHSRPGEVDHV